MGVLGADLEALRRSPHLGAKIHYQNKREIIPYQACVYIKIYCNNNKQIHCNVHFEGGSLITW